MRWFILLFPIIFPSIAFAYDDEEAAYRYVRCLVQNQKIHHYSTDPRKGDNPGLLMIRDCARERADFDRYNCGGDTLECQGVETQLVYEVIGRIK